MAVTTLLGLPIPQMSDSVGVTIPELASAMQIIDEKLGGSRIVDHNLDVVDPPNGYYVRLENGLQVCWSMPVVAEPTDWAVRNQYTYNYTNFERTLPATMKSNVGFYSFTSYTGDCGFMENNLITPYIWLELMDNAWKLKGPDLSDVTITKNVTFTYGAIGLWK